MATPKTTIRSLTPKPRDHLPALNPARLALTLQQIAALPGLPVEAKRALAQSLMAAANPNSERPDQVIKTLDTGRQKRIAAAQKVYAGILSGPSARGKAALQAMSDDEWTQIQEETNDDQTD